MYSSSFYKNQVEGSANSADIILSLIYECYQPCSVIDVGCGTGAWLKAAKNQGAEYLFGVDGVWANEFVGSSSEICFRAQDLEQLDKFERKYDLCISVEVAEHLSASNAKKFVNAICSASDVVIFSAAIKYQGGENHINEQWQSYWIEIFKENNYKCLDLLRPCIWQNDKVECWYRQNTFLFINETFDENAFNKIEHRKQPMYDIVHPLVYQEKCKLIDNIYKDPDIRFIFYSILKIIINAIKKIINLLCKH